MDLDETQSSSFAERQETQNTDTNTSSELSNDSSKLIKTPSEPASHVEAGSGFQNDDLKFDTEADKNLYKEVLEKLDIKPKESINEQKVQDVQEKSMQEIKKLEAYLNKVKSSDNSNAEVQLKQGLSQDFAKIQKLVKAGLINSAQGQNLKQQVLKKAFDKLVQAERIKRTSPALSQSGNMPVNKNEVIEAFNKSNPTFFESEARSEVLNYLKSSDVQLGKDELSKISNLVRIVEKSAIDRYLKKVSHEKILRESNEAAKQKLTANAQRSALGDKNLSRTFTREQIGKMSSAEFTKYEPYIMEQLKKGLIR